MSFDLSQLKDHYAELFSKHGATQRGVSWGCDDQRNAKRHLSIVSKFGLKKEQTFSVLDVGSGYGEFISYLPNTGLSYTGIDITELSILKGREQHTTYNFILDDFLKHEFNQDFDYVVCNGVFNLKLNNSMPEMEKFVKDTVSKMFDLCTQKAIFNLISNKVNHFDSVMFYKSPVEMLSWCFDNLTTKVDLDHSSDPYQYIITLSK